MKFSILALCLLMPLAAFAESPKVDVKANSLEVMQKKGTAVFKGAVEVKHGGMTLGSDTLTVYYGSSSDSKSVAGAVSKITAGPNVTMVDKAQGVTLTGKQAVYDVKPRTVTLTGDVVMLRGDAVLKGSKLIYNLNDGQAKVINEGGRVKASFPLGGI